MRMSDLIEACESEFEDDLEEQMLSERIIKSKGKTIAIGRKSIDALRQQTAKAALQKANADPKASCPNGYVRVKGRCVKKISVDGRRQLAKNKVRRVADAQSKRDAEKKPGFIDRMKAMFGKK